MATKKTESKEKEKETVMIENIPTGGDTIGGKLEMSEDVVATIANYAVRSVKGIYSLGKSGFLNRSIGSDPTRGVEAEVGQTQAAIDIEVVIEYGCNIHETAAELRSKIATEVEKMAGRKVVEVNIKVTGIHMQEEKKEEPPKEDPKPRVL